MKEIIGIIGGTGLYGWEDFEQTEEYYPKTPFGYPSSPIKVGNIGGVKVAFVSRHGKGHSFSPSEVPYRANIYAMKEIGVNRVFSISAVGAMQEDINIAEPVIIDQFVDRTFARKTTFFEDGIVAHVSLADPTCVSLRRLLIESGQRLGIPVREKGTYLCIEGPQFSTRAESLVYRQMGVDVIGMTNATEAKLAREAELCYVTIAIPTDYDCWHQGHEDVSVGSVLENLSQGVHKAKLLILESIKHIGDITACSCGDSLKGAIITDKELITPEVRQRLGLIIGRYV